MAATRRALLTAAALAAIPGRAPGDPVGHQGIFSLRAGQRVEESEVAQWAMTEGRRLRGLLSGTESARHIAAAYLAGIGETDHRRAAMDLDMPSVLGPMDRIAGTAASRAWLGSRIRADFEAGAVMDVDGWRLSRTEVGACLLVSGVA